MKRASVIKWRKDDDRDGVLNRIELGGETYYIDSRVLPKNKANWLPFVEKYVESAARRYMREKLLDKI